MKKTLTIVAACAAMICTATLANAQSTMTNQRGESKKEAVSPKEDAQAKPMTRSDKEKVVANRASADQLKRIETMEAKIKANENNPNVDLTQAREELAKMKKEAGIKEEEAKPSKK